MYYKTQNDLKKNYSEQIGDFEDATLKHRRLAIQQADYGSDIRGRDPEVAEF